MEDRKKFITIIIAFVTIIVVGIIGYMTLLDINFIDALYMTTITISTVGYREVADMTASAKIFSILLIFSGLGVAGYGVTSLFALFFDGSFKETWRKKRMVSKINELKDHYIICGAGEIGQIVIQQLQMKKIPFVVIEEDQEQVEELIQNGFSTIKGNATLEDVLSKAGIERAKGVICSLSTDADNVFTVLTAYLCTSSCFIKFIADEPFGVNRYLLIVLIYLF